MAAASAAMETAFDGRWGIWLSGTGRWWAARSPDAGSPDAGSPHPGSPDAPGLAAGPCTGGSFAVGPYALAPQAAAVLLVRADDPDQLRARIQEHEALPREAPIRAPGGDPAERAIRGRGRGRAPGP